MTDQLQPLTGKRENGGCINKLLPTQLDKQQIKAELSLLMFFSDHIPSYSEDLIRVLLIFFDSFIPYGPEATCMLCIGSPCTGYLRSLLEKRK